MFAITNSNDKKIIACLNPIKLKSELKLKESERNRIDSGTRTTTTAAAAAHRRNGQHNYYYHRNAREAKTAMMLMCPIHWFVLCLLEIFGFPFGARSTRPINIHLKIITLMHLWKYHAKKATNRPTDRPTRIPNQDLFDIYVSEITAFRKNKLSIFRFHERAMCSFLCEHTSHSEIYVKITREIFMHFFSNAFSAVKNGILFCDGHH